MPSLSIQKAAENAPMDANRSVTDSICPFISGKIRTQIDIKRDMDMVQTKKLLLPVFNSLIYTFILILLCVVVEEDLLKIRLCDCDILDIPLIQCLQELLCFT